MKLLASPCRHVVLNVECLEARNLPAGFGFNGAAQNLALLLNLAGFTAQLGGTVNQPAPQGSLAAVVQSGRKLVAAETSLLLDEVNLTADAAVVASPAIAAAFPASLPALAVLEQYKEVTKGQAYAASLAALTLDSFNLGKDLSAGAIDRAKTDAVKFGADALGLVGKAYTDVVADVIKVQADNKDVQEAATGFGVSLVSFLATNPTAQQAIVNVVNATVAAENELQAGLQGVVAGFQDVTNQAVQGFQNLAVSFVRFVQQLAQLSPAPAVNPDPDNDGDMDVDANGNLIDPT